MGCAGCWQGPVPCCLPIRPGVSGRVGLVGPLSLTVPLCLPHGSRLRRPATLWDTQRVPPAATKAVLWPWCWAGADGLPRPPARCSARLGRVALSVGAAQR